MSFTAHLQSGLTKLLVVLIGVGVFGVLVDASLAQTARKRPRPIDIVPLRTAQPVETIQPKIVGGTPAMANEFPFQVALVASDTPDGREQLGQFCGASLLSERWVLTAAHCVFETKASEIHVYVGATVLPRTPNERPAAAKRIKVDANGVKVHFAYNPGTSDNDIALLKLEDTAPKENLKMVSADPQAHQTFGQPGQRGTVIGWGRTREGGNTVPDLRKVDVTVQTNQLCQTNYDNFLVSFPAAGPIAITNNMFCAGEPVGGKDSCQGDSGGFFGVALGFEKFVQLGVVSFGIGCARPELFGVYTRVSNYAQWISQTMAAN